MATNIPEDRIDRIISRQQHHDFLERKQKVADLIDQAQAQEVHYTEDEQYALDMLGIDMLRRSALI